ncbi:uncharacterized protein LOC124930170 [Impatiens glandulifera]|uniref:uncharacterized protein LOC124930170 n=1 Tax=Impatiens glandulifera TaxID=253017 RepID=UPI001FB0D3B0|nr:uncharacterized protein LOC124930170 [Impatiens glandulifera]
MEELRKLEQVQSTIHLMQSRGVILSSSDANNSDADRFLAEFFRLLIQPCGKLDIDKKIHLVQENLPKISAELSKEPLLCTSGQDAFISSFITANCEDVPMVGLTAMQDANSTLEDFCRSYFMFHDMDISHPQSVFKYLSVLFFTESYIYQLDRLNEEILLQRNVAETSRTEVNVVKSIYSLNIFLEVINKSLLLAPYSLSNYNRTLPNHAAVKRSIGTSHSLTQEDWPFDNKKPLLWITSNKKQLSIEDVMKAINLKSFDYRVLNLLLYHLRGEKVNELHMEFLSVSEFLVELSDDLFDYEEDVLNNTFNILRMFVGVYGASTAPKMLLKCITEAEEKYNHLLSAVDPRLSISYEERCKEATKEGKK